MLFWLLAAVMTVLLIVALARPLRAGSGTESDDAPAVRIYKDQLAEIAADEARGLIAPAEAEGARIEVSRRLLAASAAAQRAGPRSDVSALRLIQGLAIAVPLAAVALYVSLGAPGLPDRPFAVRKTADRSEIQAAEMIARVEQRLREHPQDGQGWDVIAPIYLRMERFDDAARAYTQALTILGETPKRLMGLGEALVMQSGGMVTEEARRAWQRVAVLVPDHQEAWFWLAAADEQDGRLAEAAAGYRRMLGQAPADAPWRAMVQERLSDVERRQGTPSAPRGPSAGDVDAASKLSAGERLQMIEQMVATLAERLKKDGADPEGWERLVQSYAVLGRRDDALGALKDGRRALSGDAAGLARMEALAKRLGLEG